MFRAYFVIDGSAPDGAPGPCFGIAKSYSVLLDNTEESASDVIE